MPERVGVVLTGGTIATRDGAVLDVDESVIDLRDAPPPWVSTAVVAGWGVPAVIESRQPVCLLSENMQPRDWLRIAAAVRTLRTNGADGIVVLHGTDTAAYTAAALSYLLTDVDVPVVITGSNRPPDAVGTDAMTNVRDAATAARALERGVYLSFAGSPDAPSTVFLGTHVRKICADGAAFASPNRRPVARVADGVFEPLELATVAIQATTIRPTRSSSLDAVVMRLACHPGVPWAALTDAAIAAARGVVIELYPCATGPTGDAASLDGFVRRVRAAGVAVVGVVGQMPPGEMPTYATSDALRAAGLVFVPCLSPEAATVKLMWLLGQEGTGEEVEQQMLEPLAGDITDSVRTDLAVAAFGPGENPR